MEKLITNQIEKAEARQVLEIEAESIQLASKRLGENFSEAIDLLHKDDKKIIVTGIGKSGHLGKKLAEYKTLLQEAQVKGNKKRIDELQEEISYLENARHTIA